MQQLSLNDLYSMFKNGKMEREELEGSIYYYYIYNQEKTSLSHWKSDEYKDYISWFYPRLKKAVESYREIGSSFEAFMSKFLVLSSKEYRVQTTTQSIIEYSTWCARVPELYLHEEPPVYNYDRNDNIFLKLVDKKSGRTNTRRILALILKCYYYVSDDFVEKIAPKLGIGIDELKEMLKKIRKIRQEKDDAIYLMKERIYCQYYRCIVYEKRLSLLPENTAVFNKLKLRQEKARERLEKMRKRITRIRTKATNKQVAEVLNIRKGTVDASLHRLKAKLDKLAKQSGLN